MNERRTHVSYYKRNVTADRRSPEKHIIKRRAAEKTCPSASRGPGASSGALERMILLVKRGEIYYADLSPVVGSEQGGIRPVLILQNDVGNRFSPTIIVAAITSKTGKNRLPTHIPLKSEPDGLPRDSIILLEQIRTIDKKRLKEKLGTLNGPAMHLVEEGLLVSLGFATL